MLGYENCEFRIYNRRWSVLAAYVGVGTAMQFLWATFFSITTQAWQYYGFVDKAKGETAISNLSMIIMLGMVTFSFLSMWVLEKFGWYNSVVYSCILMSLCALARGFWGESYTAVLWCTVGLSMAQPCIVNSVGMVAGKWFPPKERATANGLGVFAIFLGVMIGMLGTPAMIQAGVSIKDALKMYGYATVILTIIFSVVASENPPSPPTYDRLVERAHLIEGLKVCLKRKSFLGAILICFSVYGIYGVFSTLIQPILNFFSGDKPLEAVTIGFIGVVIAVSGLLGTILIPIMTDKDLHKRRLPIMKMSLALSIVGFLMFTFFHQLVMISFAAILYGFFLTGIMPVLLVFGAEAAYPTSEGTSVGLLQWAGNLGSLLFLTLSTFFNGNHLYTMILLIGILLACILIASITDESLEHERLLE